MLKKALLTLVIVIVLLVAWIVTGSGITRTIDHRFDGTCRKVEGVQGPEDIALDRAAGIAWISAIEGESAGIYSFALNDPAAVPQRSVMEGIAPFPPLGISLWTGTSGNRRLFVINRRDHSVELFDVAGPTRLIHVRSIVDPLIRNPNDITAEGADSFYVSNTHRTTLDSPWRLPEMLLRLPLGNVVHFNGETAEVVATGIAYANGNALSPDGKTFYVSSASTSEVYRFNRSEDGRLDPIDTISTPGLADNIDIAEDGSLTVGLHPKSLDALAHLSGRAVTAPSRVVRIIPGAEPVIEVIYDDPGEALSAASVAPVIGTRMLIGAIRDDHLLDCEFSNQ